jgi:hypothetical protein
MRGKSAHILAPAAFIVLVDMLAIGLLRRAMRGAAPAVPLAGVPEVTP